MSFSSSQLWFSNCIVLISSDMSYTVDISWPICITLHLSVLKTTLINIDYLVSDMDDKLFYYCPQKQHVLFFIYILPIETLWLRVGLHLGREDINFVSWIRLGWTNRILCTDWSIKTHTDSSFKVYCSFNFVVVFTICMWCTKLRHESWQLFNKQILFYC